MTHDVAIVGAGYVGLPLARTFADAGKKVVLVDVDPARVAQLNQGDSYIEDVPDDVLKPLSRRGSSPPRPTTTRFATHVRSSWPSRRRCRVSASPT